MDTIPKRVFIGIKLDLSAQQACVAFQKKIAKIPARFIAPENLHITLLPPWQMTDQAEVEQKIKRVLLGIKPFKLQLSKVHYVPNPFKPKLVWAECSTSKTLFSLEVVLREEFQVERHHLYIPHVTLARFSKADQVKTPLSPANDGISVDIEVDSIELFESVLGKRIEYRILNFFPLFL